VVTAAFSTVSTTVSQPSPHHLAAISTMTITIKISVSAIDDRGNAEKPSARLIAVLDTQDVARAIDQLEKGHGSVRDHHK